MDIEKIVKEAVAKLTGDAGLLKEFAANPVKTLEDKLGIDLPDEQINAVIEGIKSKIDLSKIDVEGIAAKAGEALKSVAGEASEESKGILDKIKGIFGK